VEIGVILGDVRTSVSPRDHMDLLLRQVEAAQRNGLTYITIGHHYLYGDLRWLQPVPTLARLAAELDDHVTLATTIIQAPGSPARCSP
jgi:alkanesulfonate monooxygenase SsuD/methylene tetrahydromethanopterin reductase-like flavin-dependent oxidoreductase (luciferase family)